LPAFFRSRGLTKETPCWEAGQVTTFLQRRWFHASGATQKAEVKTQLRKEADENQGKMKDRYLIFGLGNPGKEYVKTRHNIGFRAVDELAKSFGLTLSKTKCNCNYDVTHVQTKTVYLAQPQTYMNLSGRYH